MLITSKSEQIQCTINEWRNNELSDIDYLKRIDDVFLTPYSEFPGGIEHKQEINQISALARGGIISSQSADEQIQEILRLADPQELKSHTTPLYPHSISRKKTSYVGPVVVTIIAILMYASYEIYLRSASFAVFIVAIIFFISRIQNNMLVNKTNASVLNNFINHQLNDLQLEDFKNNKIFRRIMNIVLIAVICLAIAINFDELQVVVSEQLYSEKKVTTILEALENNDPKPIKSLLSKSIIEDVGEVVINEDIQYMFSVIEGEVISYNITNPGDYGNGLFDRGRRQLRLDVFCDVITDRGEYRIYYRDYFVDTINPKNKGIDRIVVIKAEDWDNYKYFQDSRGIFRPDLFGDIDIEMANEILAALVDNDSDTILATFSDATIDKVGRYNLMRGIELLCSTLEGNVISCTRSGVGYFRSIHDGKETKHVSTRFEVTTDKDRYYLYIEDNNVVESNPYHVGINKLDFTQGDISPFGKLFSYDFVGIYSVNNAHYWYG